MHADANRPLCRATRADGRPCRARAMPGQTLCFGHNDAFAAKRAEARRQGGLNKASAIRLRKLTPPKLLPIFDRLERALVEVHEGSLAPQAATAMASLGRALTAILTTGELEERLRTLEQTRKEGLKDGLEWSNRKLGG